MSKEKSQNQILKEQCAEKMKSIRQKEKLTQHDMADILNIKQPNVVKLEKSDKISIDKYTSFFEKL